MSNLWTAKDEHLFNEMKARRVRILRERQERLATALANCPGQHISAIPALAEALVSNAREVYAALGPFVTGGVE